MAALMLPSAVLTQLKAGVRAAAAPEPVLTTWWRHPASITAPKHARPSLTTSQPGSRLRLAKPEIAWPQKLVTRRSFRRIGLRSGCTLLHGSAGWRRRPGEVGGSCPRSQTPDPAVPFKAHADRRHHIPRQRHRVTNWSEYDAARRGRGSLTVWFSEAAIQAWRAEPRTTRGGQPWYSPLL